MPPANPVASDPEAKKRAARETIDILHEISTLLVRPTPFAHTSHQTSPQNSPRKQHSQVTQNTDLDRQSLSYCVSLIENGVNPEALAVRLSHRGCEHDTL
jgi:mitotic-spindle organizing protein 1